MKKINKDYIAGYLENVGGFYAMDSKTRRLKTPQFKMVIQKNLKTKLQLTKKIIKYFKENEDINFNFWSDNEKVVWQITRFDEIDRLLNFFRENCYLEKTNQQEIREIINKRKEDEKAKKQKKNIKTEEY